MAKNKDYGLGRIHAHDERDKLFLVRELLPADIKITHKAWNASGYWGNQLNTPMCVGFSLCHWLEDGPITHGGIPPIIAPEKIYRGAQDNDEWKGHDYEGTSVRGGAKWLQTEGYIKEYRWAFTKEDFVDTLLTMGPVVFGINWYEAMFEPDSKGFIKIGGDIAGGHAIKADAVNVSKQWVRLKQSWGRDWGKNGFCYISFDDIERLLSEQGECMIAIENEDSFINTDV